MLATPAASSPSHLQLDSLAAEVDSLTDIRALLGRYGSTQSADSVKGTAHALSDEEHQLAVIAQLDSILDSLHSTSHAATQPHSHSSQSEQQQWPVERSDADDDDLTFITQLTWRNEQHQDSVITGGSSQPLTASTQAESQCEPPVQQQPHSVEAVLRDEEGFRMTVREADRVAAIDTLLAALQCEEREGRKRRFVRIRGRARQQSSQPNKSDKRHHSLPTLFKASSCISATGATSAHPAAALSPSSASSSDVTDPTPPSIDCQLLALDAQLANFNAAQSEDDWLPLEYDQPDCNVSWTAASSSSSNIHGRPPLPPEQPWLYVSRLRDMYPLLPRPYQPHTQQSSDEDPFSWLDGLDEEGGQAAEEQLDRAIEQDSILPHTDSEDDGEVEEKKQQTSNAVRRSSVALPAPPPPLTTLPSAVHVDNNTMHAATTSSFVSSRGVQRAHGKVGATLAEREQYVAATSDAARRRVKRLIAQAEERKQAARQQQQPHGTQSGAVEGHSTASPSSRTIRVRTSEERSGGALPRKGASGLPLALPQRPPTC